MADLEQSVATDYQPNESPPNDTRTITTHPNGEFPCELNDYRSPPNESQGTPSCETHPARSPPTHTHFKEFSNETNKTQQIVSPLHETQTIMSPPSETPPTGAIHTTDIRQNLLHSIKVEVTNQMYEEESPGVTRVGGEPHNEDIKPTRPSVNHNALPSRGMNRKLVALRTNVENRSMALTNAWSELNDLLGDYQAELFSTEIMTQNYDNISNVDQLRSDLIERDAVVRDKDSRIQELEESLDRIQRQDEQLNLDISVKESLLSKYQDDLLQKEASLMTANAKVARLENRIRTLEAKVAASSIADSGPPRKMMRPQYNSPGRLTGTPGRFTAGSVGRPSFASTGRFPAAVGRLSASTTPGLIRKRPMIPSQTIRRIIPAAKPNQPVPKQPIVCIEVDDDEELRQVSQASGGLLDTTPNNTQAAGYIDTWSDQDNSGLESDTTSLQSLPGASALSFPLSMTTSDITDVNQALMMTDSQPAFPGHEEMDSQPWPVQMSQVDLSQMQSQMGLQNPSNKEDAYNNVEEPLEDQSLNSYTKRVCAAVLLCHGHTLSISGIKGRGPIIARQKNRQYLKQVMLYLELIQLGTVRDGNMLAKSHPETVTDAVLAPFGINKEQYEESYTKPIYDLSIRVKPTCDYMKSICDVNRTCAAILLCRGPKLDKNTFDMCSILDHFTAMEIRWLFGKLVSEGLGNIKAQIFNKTKPSEVLGSRLSKYYITTTEYMAAFETGSKIFTDLKVYPDQLELDFSTYGYSINTINKANSSAEMFVKYNAEEEISHPFAVEDHKDDCGTYEEEDANIEKSFPIDKNMKKHIKKIYVALLLTKGNTILVQLLKYKKRPLSSTSKYLLRSCLLQLQSMGFGVMDGAIFQKSKPNDVDLDILNFFDVSLSAYKQAYRAVLPPSAQKQVTHHKIRNKMWYTKQKARQKVKDKAKREAAKKSNTADDRRKQCSGLANIVRSKKVTKHQRDNTVKAKSEAGINEKLTKESDVRASASNVTKGGSSNTNTERKLVSATGVKSHLRGRKFKKMCLACLLTKGHTIFVVLLGSSGKVALRGLSVKQILSMIKKLSEQGFGRIQGKAFVKTPPKEVSVEMLKLYNINIAQYEEAYCKPLSTTILRYLKRNSMSRAAEDGYSDPIDYETLAHILRARGHSVTTRNLYQKMKLPFFELRQLFTTLTNLGFGQHVGVLFMKARPDQLSDSMLHPFNISLEDYRKSYDAPILSHVAKAIDKIAEEDDQSELVNDSTPALGDQYLEDHDNPSMEQSTNESIDETCTMVLLSPGPSLELRALQTCGSAKLRDLSCDDIKDAFLTLEFKGFGEINNNTFIKNPPEDITQSMLREYGVRKADYKHSYKVKNFPSTKPPEKEVLRRKKLVSSNMDAAHSQKKRKRLSDSLSLDESFSAISSSTPTRTATAVHCSKPSNERKDDSSPSENQSVTKRKAGRPRKVNVAETIATTTSVTGDFA